MLLIKIIGRVLLVVLATAILPQQIGAQAQDKTPDIPTIDGKRIALIIGNRNYQHADAWSELPNAENDVREIARILSDPARGPAKFDVELVVDGTRKDILDAVGRFADKSGNYQVALIYYGGHGFQFDKKNYIVPSDAPGAVPAKQVNRFYIDIDRDIIEPATSSSINIVFLDACRDKVAIVTGDDGTRGREGVSEFGSINLASIEAPRAQIFYATSPGGKAYDAAPPGSKLSPFARALTTRMSRPGLELSTLVLGVSIDVVEATKGLGRPQIPLPQGSPRSYFYFLPEALPVAAVGAAAVQPSPTPRKRVQISATTLNTVDEPMIVARVLNDHTPAELLAMAQDGDPLAAYLVGYMFRYGVSLPHDLDAARTWLGKAAAMGTPQGQLEYGHLLLNSPRSGTDIADARKLFEKASAQGYAKAQAHYASALLNGQFGPALSDRTLSIRLYHDAAAQGYPGAISSLAFLGEKAESLARLEALAGAGNADGDHLLCGINMLDADWEKAARHCKIAAEARFVDAQANLALLYANGKGVEQSTSKARDWARIALSQLDLRADLKRSIANLAD